MGRSQNIEMLWQAIYMLSDGFVETRKQLAILLKAGMLKELDEGWNVKKSLAY